MRDESAPAQAADLAERILDEVSAAEQDWCLVGQWARELAALAAATAAPATSSERELPRP
jgi:hypothetical protein